MFALVIGIVLLVLIIAATAFIAHTGMDMFSDANELRLLLGGYFGLYVLAAVVFKIALPAPAATAVDAGSLFGVWSEAAEGVAGGLSVAAAPFFRLAGGGTFAGR